MISRRVGRNNSSDLILLTRRDNIAELGERKVGLNFYQNRFRGAIFRGYSLEQDRQQLALLERAQARRIRRADVENEVVGEIPQPAKRLQVIVRRLVNGREFGFANVDADRNCRPATAFAQPAQTVGHDIGAVVVEAETINQRLLLAVAENARPRISRLRLGRYGPDFDETETKRRPGRKSDTVFIEAGGQTNRIRKCNAEERDPFGRGLESL